MMFPCRLMCALSQQGTYLSFETCRSQTSCGPRDIVLPSVYIQNIDTAGLNVSFDNPQFIYIWHGDPFIPENGKNTIVVSGTSDGGNAPSLTLGAGSGPDALSMEVVIVAWDTAGNRPMPGTGSTAQIPFVPASVIVPYSQLSFPSLGTLNIFGPKGTKRKGTYVATANGPWANAVSVTQMFSPVYGEAYRVACRVGFASDDAGNPLTIPRVELHLNE